MARRGDPMSSLDGLIRRLRAAGCVFAEREAQLIAATFEVGSTRERAVRRRESGEPLEYVVGAADFAGISVAVGAPAFIPRARAVALVDAVDQVRPALGAGTTALDLGCGCGAIAAALSHRHSGWAVHACEIDPAAAAWAERNAVTYGYVVHVGSWFEPLPPELRGRIDVVVAHLPYVPSGDVDLLPRDFRDHEPRQAVDGGSDGLEPFRSVCAGCRAWLTATGLLLTQVTWQQVDRARSIAEGLDLAAEPLVVEHADDEDTTVLVVRGASSSASRQG